MPRFTGTIANNQLLINVFVAKNLPNHKSTLFKGLIDTGAMSTAISSNVASSLSLDPVGKTTMNSASHIISVNVYQLLMGIPITENNVLTPMKPFLITAMEAPNLQNYDLLIGMDVLSQCILIVNGDRFTIAY